MAKSARATTDAIEGRRPDLEHELSETFSVKWTFERDVPADRFDHEKSLHNQARFEALDHHVVDTYAEAVKRGDKFPAVVAYRPTARGKLVVIDGNHRLAAHEKAGASLHVYEVDRATDPRTIALMTFALNTRHGRPTSEAERVQQALYLIDNGASQGQAADAVNLPERILKRALARTQADRRADEVGIRRNEWDTLPTTARARLAGIATDEGFSAAARFAFAARLDVTEVFELVGLLNATRSGQRQVAIVKAQREAMAERIQQNGSGVMTSADRRAVSPKGRLGMALGQFAALPEDDGVLVSSYAAPEREAAAQKFRAAAERLSRLADKLSDA